jgi:hypothetical protein
MYILTNCKIPELSNIGLVLGEEKERKMKKMRRK